MHQKIVEKLRTSRSPEFVSDLDLHSYQVNESCSSVTISKNKIENSIDSMTKPNMNVAGIKEAFVSKDYDWKWLEDEANCKCAL